LITEPRITGIYLFDWFSDFAPPSLVLKICERMASSRVLRAWPGWFLGAGQSAVRISTVVRRMLWRWFSCRCPDKAFILNWHYGVKVVAYPKVATCRSLFLTGYYEPNECCFLNALLKPGMVFIDIGANLGLYSLFASKFVGETGTVLAIEPSEREYTRLKKNIELNYCSNVQPMMLAISNGSQEKELLIAEQEHSGLNTLGTFAYGGVQSEGRQRVKTERLDDIVQKLGLSRVDVIKIDVEGHESFVLLGAKETLSKYRPILLVEVADRALAAQGCNSSQILDFLQRLGYRIYLFSKQTGLPVGLDWNVDHFDSENVIAVHRTSQVKIG